MERYRTQTTLPQIGEEGQARLNAARVTVVGAGGLGCPLLMALALAGVGHIQLIDQDTVALSNLNRQFFYTPEDVGQPKAPLAQAFLRRLNPDLDIKAVTARLEPANIDSLLSGSDLVVDCVDNVATRLWVNDYCVREALPLVEAGIGGFYGFVLSVGPHSPCVRCLGLDKQPEPVTKEALASTAGVVASLEAAEALKLLLGVGEPLFGRILYYDGLLGSFDELSFKQSADCLWHGTKD